MKESSNAVEATSYQKAQEEWSSRVGSAKAQARHWQFACLASLCVAILLIISIVVLLSVQKTHVYVAEVKPQENIVNVTPIDAPYVPSQAEHEYFIAKFIHSIMGLSLDPVVVRSAWMNAYAWVEGPAIAQLNQYAAMHDPFMQVGRMTKVVKIRTFHPMGRNSYSFTWLQTTYDMKGTVQHTDIYNGIFTLAKSETPANAQALLDNPLGLKIVYFTFSVEGRS